MRRSMNGMIAIENSTRACPRERGARVVAEFERRFRSLMTAANG
jgi:hypothetical protein